MVQASGKIANARRLLRKRSNEVAHARHADIGLSRNAGE